MTESWSIRRGIRQRLVACCRFGLIGTVLLLVAAQDPAQRPNRQPPTVEALPVPLLPDTEALFPDELPPLPLPLVKLAPPRPAEGAASVGAFVEGLKGNDAVLNVTLGQGRILTMKEDISGPMDQALVALGDPSVMNFVVLSPRQLRLIGLRIGSTDLSITTAQGRNYSFEVRVTADLGLLETRLKALFPDTSLALSQLGGNIVVEGQARDSGQVVKIMQVITTYVNAIMSPTPTMGQSQTAIPTAPATGVPAPPAPMPPSATLLGPSANTNTQVTVSPESAPSGPSGDIPIIAPRIINLLRVPTSQQVLLKVRVAELNRSALRRIGANFLGIDPKTGAIVGSQIANTTTAVGAIGESVLQPTGRAKGLVGAARLPTGTNATVFGIFQDSNFEFMLDALRQNAMLKILAEPNLVALSGQRASFLAGGEFPVPIPQVSAGGSAPTITVSFKQFGVKLDFLPTITDGDVIRLAVAPEVSSIDFAIATTLVSGGSPVPGLNTRKAQTTVELRQGQTLAIAGLLQLELSATMNRIPGLGDLPILGPFFSNTEGRRVEKELVVLVTPYLVEPMKNGEVPPGPGDEVNEPNDLEFYLLNRIESRTGRDLRSTTSWDDPFRLVQLLKLEQKYVSGPSGFSK